MRPATALTCPSGISLIGRHGSSPILWTGLVWLVVAFEALEGWAQVLDVPPQVTSPQPVPVATVPAPMLVRDDEVEAKPETLPRNGIRPQDAMMVRARIERYALGGLRDRKQADTRLNLLAKLRLAEVDQVAQLSETQKSKLALAARGDIKKYFDQFEAIWRSLEAVQNDPQKLANFYRESMSALQESPIRVRTGADSVFGKALKKTLDVHQLGVIEHMSRQRERVRQEARLGSILLSLDYNLGLTSGQCRDVLKLVVDETVPLKVQRPISDSAGRLEFFFVIHQLSQLPQERIRPILHVQQRTCLEDLYRQCAQFQAMMTKQGLLPIGPHPERWDDSIVLEEVRAEVTP